MRTGQKTAFMSSLPIPVLIRDDGDLGVCDVLAALPGTVTASASADFCGVPCLPNSTGSQPASSDSSYCVAHTSTANSRFDLVFCYTAIPVCRRFDAFSSCRRSFTPVTSAFDDRHRLAFQMIQIPSAIAITFIKQEHRDLTYLVRSTSLRFIYVVSSNLVLLRASQPCLPSFTFQEDVRSLLLIMLNGRIFTIATATWMG